MLFNDLIGRIDCQDPCGGIGEIDQSVFAENQPVNLEAPSCNEWNTGFFEKTPNLIGKINWIFNSLYAASKSTYSSVFGIGQEWELLTSQRSIGVVYTNATEKLIIVNVRAGSSTVADFVLGLSVNGTGVASFKSINGALINVSVAVPPGQTYRATIIDEPLFLDIDWLELR